jgi:ferrous iron transport protein B
MLTLADLKNGQKAIITKVKGSGAFRKRIIEMGFVVGKEVTVIKNAPLKDPIEYNILGYDVSLRRSEARLIEVSTKKQEVVKKFDGTIETDNEPVITNENSKIINVALVGNPNCGKTTLFNYASKSKEKTGNYGGVTVGAAQAKFKYKGYTFKLTDLPGTYSITSYTPEELYVRSHIIEEVPDIVLNVIDTSNLERNLYLTTQLIDMDLRVVVALNMWDEFIHKGDRFDYQSLGKMIGIPMVPIVASKGKYIDKLFDKIIDVFEDRDNDVRHIHINYGKYTEKIIKELQELIRRPGNEALTSVISPRYLSLKLLEQDPEEIKRVKEKCVNAAEILAKAEEEAKKLEKLRNEPVETVITDAKYGFIEGALRETYKPAGTEKAKINQSRIIDSIVTSKILSYPIFLFAMWITFQATFYIGGYPMQWIQAGVDGLSSFIKNIMPEGIIRDALADGIVQGVGGVVIFLPNILILFFFITLMEATGYMARVAFIVDKLMHRIGLHGKSFIPMLMGFGCNVPAIMATRTIESKSDRLVTMLIIPFMSCSARYPVYILIISAFFPEHQGTMLFAIYLFGIFLAGIVAMILKKTLFKVNTIPFVMELPPYRVPPVKSVLKQTWFKGEQYLRKMGTTILVASLIIWVLGYFPKGENIDKKYQKQVDTINKTYKNELNKASTNDKIYITKLLEKKNSLLDSLNRERQLVKQENSYIGRIGKFIEPVISPLGFEWRMGVSLVAGSAAKEVVISTLSVLFQSDPNSNNSQILVHRLKDAVYTSGPKKGEHVFTPLVALSFMLFILIYFPCVAVIAAIKNESGQWKWSLFLAAYTTFMAWIISFGVYQTGTLLGY